MKTTLFTLLAILVILVSCNTNQTNNESAEPKAEDLISISIDVEGMDCTGCENTIETNVATLDGIEEVQASHTEKTTIVKFDKTKTDLDNIKTKIEEKGYTVTSHEIVSE